MKKLVLILGLVMGSMIASDAIAAINVNGTVIEHNDGSKKECKRKCKKACSKKDKEESKEKKCSKEGKTCCKKKTTEAPKEETPAK